MNLKELIVECDKCHQKNKRTVRVYDQNEFSDPKSGTILSSFWCSWCKEPQVIRYKFNKTDQGDYLPEVTSRIEPSSFNSPKELEKGITIRPRASKPGNRH